MKKTRIVMILLSLLLLFSCTTETPVTADLTISTDSKTPVTYVLKPSEGGTRTGVVSASSSKIESDLPKGDASIVYYGVDKDAKRVAVASIGNDGSVALSMKESVPQEIFISQPATAAARDLSVTAVGEYSFFIFNEDGTGWKTTLKIDATTKLPSFGTVSIGWKIDGNTRLVADAEGSPIRLTVSGDVLVQGNMKWERAPEVETDKTIDGVWHVFGMKPLANGLPTPALVQIAIGNEGKDVRLRASIDAAGIPSDKISSQMKENVELDLSSLLAGKITDVRFSENGGFAIVKIGRARIPLIRSNAYPAIEMWNSTTPASKKTFTLAQILNYIDSAKVTIEGKEVSVKSLLGQVDVVTTATGKTVDISGVWKTDDDTWTTSYRISKSEKGRVAILAPERSGFTVYEIITGADKKMSLKNCGYYNVELDVKTLTYAGEKVGSAELLARPEKSLDKLVDVVIGTVFEGKTSADFSIVVDNGTLKLSMPNPKATADMELKIATVTIADGKIGFTFSSMEIFKNLESLGIAIPEESKKFLGVKFDVVFPLIDDGKILLGQIGDTPIII